MLLEGFQTSSQDTGPLSFPTRAFKSYSFSSSSILSFFLKECQRPTWGWVFPGMVDLKGTTWDESNIPKEHDKIGFEQFLWFHVWLILEKSVAENESERHPRVCPLLLNFVKMSTVSARFWEDGKLADRAKRQVCALLAYTSVSLTSCFWRAFGVLARVVLRCRGISNSNTA